MAPFHHIAAIAGLVLAAWALIRIPRGLFAEIEGGAPNPRTEWVLTGAILVVGLAAFEAWRGGAPEARFILGLVMMAFAAVVAADIRFLTIPDLYSIVPAAAALAGPLSPGLEQAALGALVCGGLLAAVAWYWKRRTAVEGIGFGDVKLAAAIGALLGAQNGLWAITASAGGGAVLGLILQARRKDAEAPLLFPYGAPLALAGAIFLGLGVWA